MGLPQTHVAQRPPAGRSIVSTPALVPELGVIVAKTPPLVFLTSNNVRDLGDALKRRCLHLHIPLPEADLEERIVATRVPGIEAALTEKLVAFVQSLRTIDLRKAPSIDAYDYEDFRLVGYEAQAHIKAPVAV